MTKRIFPVVGMACAACAAHVEKKLNSLDGIESVTVSLINRIATITYDEKRVTPDHMKKALSSIGFDLVTEQKVSAAIVERQEQKALLKKMALSWIFAALVMTASMTQALSPYNDQVALIIAIANIYFCGTTFYTNAFKQLRNRFFSMDTLVALSTGVAFSYSVFATFWGESVWGERGIGWHTYFEPSVMIITFVLTGRFLEEKAKHQTAKSIRELMGMQPKTAHLAAKTSPTDGEEGLRDVPIATISHGDILEVNAGERIPVDGTVTWAESFMNPDAAYVDEAMITGEPTPVGKERGAKVLAGTILKQGRLRMSAQEVGEKTSLARIIAMVQEAQTSKAPVQRFADKAAYVFVPVIVGIAVLTLCTWLAIGGLDIMPRAIMSAVAVLVIACPCAMGLATPTALMVGIGKAAKKNILIKDAKALENISKADCIVMDKTGTLTIPNTGIDFTKASDMPFEERETLKPNATETIVFLNENGIDIHLMSGDNDEAVRFWAEKARIKNYHSKALPDDKEQLVRELKEKGHVVVMIGDGINDSQALALADVSMAMGNGTDVAMDVAQVTLMGNDLRSIADTIRLGRQTVRLI